MQTWTSNTLHNAIMEAGGKDRPPMLASGNYVQWKSRIKKYIDTKPNHELIHYCLKNPPYKYTCTDKAVPVTEGSSKTTTERYMENYKNVSQDIRDQLNAEAKVVQIILKGIDNDIYSTVDACPNACEIWKAIERLKQGESINVQDLETNLYWEFRKFTSRDGDHLNRITQEWQRFVTLVKQSQELKTVSYHKLYDILKQHKNEVNEIRAERLARTANPLALMLNNNKFTILKIILLTTLKIPQPDHNKLLPETKEKQLSTLLHRYMIKNLLWLLKMMKCTTVVQKSRIQCYNCKEFGHVARECQKSKRPKDAAYHKEKMLLYAADNSRLIFDTKPLEKVPNNDNYNVFAIESRNLEQSNSVNDTYPIEQDKRNVIIDSLYMSYDKEQIDHDDDLANERDLLASLIEKLKCEIDDNKNRNKFLETSKKALVDQLKCEIEDFKTKNKSLESSNNHFKEANNELSKTNELMYKDLKKFQAELDRYNDVKYASKVEIDCAKAKWDLMSYKMESEKSFNAYTRKINDLNQMILEMKKELFAHQETIYIMSQQKEAQIKFHKTREDKELDKVIALENKIKVLDNTVYKTGQSVQTMNMLNHNCKTSFAKPEFLKKAQRANPRLYDIGCYNDNLALMLAPESEEVIRLEKESRLKLSDLIRPFDYEKLNNLYDLFVPQREKSSTQRYFSKRSKISHTPVNNKNSKESFNKQQLC
nr:hypothetical protein [Tanacetum cinerariifolium]